MEMNCGQKWSLNATVVIWVAGWLAVQTVHCSQAEDKFRNYYTCQHNTDPTTLNALTDLDCCMRAVIHACPHIAGRETSV